MATVARMQNAMANIALCQAIFCADGVPAETRLDGIGRILGLRRVTAETDATDTSAATINHMLATERRARTSQSAGTGTKANTGTGTQRAVKVSRRDELLHIIRTSDGLTRGEILKRMGLKGDTKGEMSISNALTTLKKRNQIRREDGKYLPADGGTDEAETVQQGTLQQLQEEAA